MVCKAVCSSELSDFNQINRVRNGWRSDDFHSEDDWSLKNDVNCPTEKFDQNGFTGEIKRRGKGQI